ncbi:MAG: DUF3106 domain-containing protein [Janthinobacterium lividum]
MQGAVILSSPRFRPSCRAATAGIVAWMMLVAGMGVAVGAPTLTPPPAPGARPAAVKSSASKPHWRDLNAEQQQALGPLSSHWDSLSETQKRKWLVISQNQASLSPAEKAVQHSRMTEWVGLSRQQREQARFNFDEVKHVPAAERKAKWEAYQALSAAEKQRLADSADKRPQGAAGTIRPVPAQKLAPVPVSRGVGGSGPRIEIAPHARSAGAATVVPAAVNKPTPAASEVAPAASTSIPAAAPVVPLLPN